MATDTPEFSTVERKRLKQLIDLETLPPKFTLNAQEGGVANNSNVRIANVKLEEGQELKVFVAQISPGVGGDAGALLQILDQDGGDVVYEANSGDGTEIEYNPTSTLFRYEGSGSFITFRMRNETGGSTNLSGFFTITIDDESVEKEINGS